MSLKCNILLDYCTNMLYSYYKKAKSEDLPTLDENLVKHRCLLEKLKPLDQKVQYQIEKIAQGSSQDLLLKANPQSMDTQLHITQKEGIYKAPNSISVPYYDSKTPKQARDEQRLKRRLAQSALMENLKEEIGDEPVEVREPYNRKLKYVEKEQEKYELDNFTRVALSKKEKRLRRQLERTGDQEEDIGGFLRLLEKSRKGPSLEESINYTRKKPKRGHK